MAVFAHPSRCLSTQPQRSPVLTFAAEMLSTLANGQKVDALPVSPSESKTLQNLSQCPHSFDQAVIVFKSVLLGNDSMIYADDDAGVGLEFEPSLQVGQSFKDS